MKEFIMNMLDNMTRSEFHFAFYYFIGIVYVFAVSYGIYLLANINGPQKKFHGFAILFLFVFMLYLTPFIALKTTDAVQDFAASAWNELYTPVESASQYYFRPLLDANGEESQYIMVEVEPLPSIN